MKKFFLLRAVCHNNPLMVPTLPPLAMERNVEARKILQRNPRVATGQMHSAALQKCRKGILSANSLISLWIKKAWRKECTRLISTF